MSSIRINLTEYFKKVQLQYEDGVQIREEFLPSKFKEATQKGVKIEFDFEGSYVIPAAFFEQAFVQFIKNNNLSAEHVMEHIDFLPKGTYLDHFFEVGKELMECTHDSPTKKIIENDKMKYIMQGRFGEDVVDYGIIPVMNMSKENGTFDASKYIIGMFVQLKVEQYPKEYRVTGKEGEKFNDLESAVLHVAKKYREIEKNIPTVHLGDNFEKEILSFFTEIQPVLLMQKDRMMKRLQKEKSENTKDGKGSTKKTTNFFGRD